MISISSYPQYKSHNFKFGQQSVSQPISAHDISDVLAKGDKSLNENNYNEALKYYTQAIQQNPDEINVYKKLAKTQFYLKDYKIAEKNYEKYLNKNPNDVDAWIELGETQRQSGFYKKAIDTFKKALLIEPDNDLAKRNLYSTENNLSSVYSSVKAFEDRAEYSDTNLRLAINMAIDYLSPDYIKDIQDVTIQFGKTASMGGTPNIAQYENNKKTITISDTYTYAAPQLIAAYLVHEMVHAKDKDAYTSVREEQDAYEIATKFWIKNANNIKDPEMDYAADLYNQSPTALKDRVAEIYRLRDPEISETSPNHPPKKIFHFNLSKNKAASQSIKEYDFIA